MEAYKKQKILTMYKIFVYETELQEHFSKVINTKNLL